MSVSTENLNRISLALHTKVGLLHRSIIATWSPYRFKKLKAFVKVIRFHEDCHEFLLNFVVKRTYSSIFSLYLLKVRVTFVKNEFCRTSKKTKRYLKSWRSCNNSLQLTLE
jgi:NADPH-dependent 7-cyano-7-deazaguanine reductase QueF